MCWVCVVPSALTAEPLGYVSLQQPLEQIFELCGERVWQLHILRKRGGREEGGRKRGREDTRRGESENGLFENRLT